MTKATLEASADDMDYIISEAVPLDRETHVVKKDGTLENFDLHKIIVAVNKSAERVLVHFNEQDLIDICSFVTKRLNEEGVDKVDIVELHSLVECALQQVDPQVALSYRNYRNYKQDFVGMLDKVFQESQRIMYLGDKSNANADSTLVTTKRSLMFNELSTQLYKKFFLNKAELQALKEGYIYIHDIGSRLLTTNCCIADIGAILKGGFEMSNIWYNEPKTLDVAFGVIADIVLSASGAQYGGYTVGEVDKLLEPYAEKSYKIYYDEAIEFGASEEKADEYAWKKLVRETEQGVQQWEYKFNTLSSARGDFSFITATFGLGKSRICKMISKTFMDVRAKGQGRKGFEKPVLFPKLIFLYDENLHGEGKELEDVFNCAVECSKVAMYPDYTSLSGSNYVGQVYKRYGTPVSSMGCRSFLSPWYIRGGMHPADEDDKPIYVGRGNVGVISLNLPMIFMQAKEEGKEFYTLLHYYLELIRNLHLRTIEYLGHMKASCNPLMYTQGGFFGGHLQPDDEIAPVIRSFTTSFGITSLNELQRLYNGKSIREDGEFALEVMKYINKYVDRVKEEDGVLHSIYMTPAESTCATQLQQFRKKYGIIKNVSDREYFTNGFHCHVSEDITPIEKQDLEGRFIDQAKGGQIYFNKFNCNYNTAAFKTLIRRAMSKGFYFGTNFAKSFCEDCGYEELDMDVCPKCGSTNVTQINRVCGYLGYSRINGDTRFNKGKLAEVKDRVSY